MIRTLLIMLLVTTLVWLVKPIPEPVVRVLKVEVPVVVKETETKYIDKPIYIPDIQYVDRVEIVYIPQPMRHFTTKAELKQWLRNDDTDKMVYEAFGKVDCDEFAYALQARAYSSGYLISVEWTYVNGQLHVQNAALIGNEVYLIEPQNDNVTYFNYLD